MNITIHLFEVIRHQCIPIPCNVVKFRISILKQPVPAPIIMQKF